MYAHMAAKSAELEAEREFTSKAAAMADGIDGKFSALQRRLNDKEATNMALQVCVQINRSIQHINRFIQ